ncbi:DNA polymerase III subunit alpha [Frankliniella fusca]|uniref:DNA polymerase III subunit alpha n=1 Tax=Frankliniella fusca TaxID=407009 RepID=A0AAE1I409_9NEOP|nr:DNA polymerase III subunit alpha [Frankliniella fusca]KAK3911334.1 DNA polymerase III subunit alpha [Frankliniella fusca]KAK3932939.1 DNA polymerase III subunit alpha [Frankliniella fusca]KAK3932942.1 DNA polymerase III subunit alpha [Frankliniella fusca]KAK3933113.1 DNA polymerase III subunit alpha [Frankliniella fusca]
MAETPNWQSLAAAFNSIASNPEFTSIKELTPGARYEVRNMCRISTKHGSKIKAELKDLGGESLFVVLPSRLARLTDAQIEGINDMVHSGHIPWFIFKSVTESGAYDVELVFDE